MSDDDSESSLNLGRWDQRQRLYSDLSPEAPAFFPLAQRILMIPQTQSMNNQRSESMERSTNDSSAHRGQDQLPTYENSHEYTPSHFIPIYGAGHGMFYDTATKLFRGDGLPRPTFERPSGTIPGRYLRMPRLVRPWEQPEDQFHIQPTVFTSQALPTTPNDAHGIKRQYFCSCTGSWQLQPHDCAAEQQEHEAQHINASPALRSVQDLPEGWVTRQVSIGNMSYLRWDAAVEETDFAAEREAAGLHAIDNLDVRAPPEITEAWEFEDSTYDEPEDFAYEEGKEQQAADIPKNVGSGDKLISKRNQERKRARAKKKAEEEEVAAAVGVEEEKIGKEPGNGGTSGSAPDSHAVDLSGTGEEAAEEEQKTCNEDPGDELRNNGSAPNSCIMDLSVKGEEVAVEKDEKIRHDNSVDDGSAPDDHVVDLSGLEYFFF